MSCSCTGACACEAQDEATIEVVDGRACASANPCIDPTMVLPNQSLAEATPGIELRQITPSEARRSTIFRQQKIVDRARQRLTLIGLRPYNVDLVWIAWTGATRGDGYEAVIERIALVPNPVVVDLSSVSMSVVATGVLPMGSVRLEKVSACYTSDVLLGRLAPEFATYANRFKFYYEIYEDGRTTPAERMKFRASSQPHREPFGWKISLERISADAERDGTPAEARS